MSFSSLSVVREANRARATRENRAYWFDQGAMSFFSTTFPDGETLIRGCLFVTSETYRDGDPNHPRKFTLRYAAPSGQIHTVGDFQGHDTAQSARAAAYVLDLVAFAAECEPAPVDPPAAPALTLNQAIGQYLLDTHPDSRKA